MSFLNWLVLWVYMFRFELKYFDPFLVLDEFSGGHLCIFLCFLIWITKNIVVNLVLYSKNMKFWNIAVTAPAGFPDHPHRGLPIGSSVSFMFFNDLICLVSNLFLHCGCFFFYFSFNRIWDSHIHVAGRANIYWLSSLAFPPLIID